MNIMLTIKTLSLTFFSSAEYCFHIWIWNRYFLTKDFLDCQILNFLSSGQNRWIHSQL
jgi:hypothetical protein